MHKSIYLSQRYQDLLLIWQSKTPVNFFCMISFGNTKGDVAFFAHIPDITSFRVFGAHHIKLPCVYFFFQYVELLTGSDVPWGIMDYDLLPTKWKNSFLYHCIHVLVVVYNTLRFSDSSIGLPVNLMCWYHLVGVKGWKHSNFPFILPF